MNIEAALARYFPGGMISSLYLYMSTIPGTVREDNYWFYSISNLAYSLIIVLHLSWILVFFLLGQTTMMWLQFISISSYIVAIALNRKGYHLAGMAIGLIEACTHQLIAVASFGWLTGFQNLIPLIALMPFLKYNEKWVTKIAMGVICLLFYLYIDIYIKNKTPLHLLSQSATNFFNFSNSILCFILVALWGIVLAISYQRTVDALISKEHELSAAEKAREQADMRNQLDVKERDNEIFLLRNVELKASNEEITRQKERIEAIISEQELIILRRTKELAESNTKLTELNKKLLDLIQYNAHSLREPLTRIMGAMIVADYATIEEFKQELWPEMGRAVSDLDNRLKEVISLADDTIKLYVKQ